MEKIVEILLKEIVASPTVTKVMLMVVLLLLFASLTIMLWGGKKIYAAMTENYKAVRQEIKLLHFKVDSQDYALGKRLNDGYKKIRDDHFNELKDNDNFIND